MRVSSPDLITCFSLALPVLAMLLAVVAVLFSRLKQLRQKPARTRKRRLFAISAINATVGLAFLPLGSIYHPSLIEVAKAQIRQQEDVDEDDNGDPETSAKHLLRQLRRIRRGEKVETLFLRRE